ncbi:MAG TPA: flavin reductase family protein [Candidatus Binatia bacterium]|jgi:flavin reductase (DIM6/NTAB) family NADH-FMN oxidoreductase RutF
MGNLDSANKIDVPSQHWDRLFAPSACLVMITTVDEAGRVNAASFGTCVRVCHEPVYIAFTVGATKDTYHNVLATNQFVVNVPPFEREVLEKVRVVGLEFPPQVNELEKAGLSALPSRIVKPPRIVECRSHFECEVEWTKQWLHRLMVVGKVVAASVDQGCVDKDGYVLWNNLKPAHYCGNAYKNGFVAAYQTMHVDMIYNEPIDARPRQP